MLTAPNLVDPDNLPEGVLRPDQLGEYLQGLNGAKVTGHLTERQSPLFKATGTGFPLNPIPFVTNLLGGVLGDIADDDPESPTVTGPDDIPKLVPKMFSGLPFMDMFEGLSQAIQGLFTGGGALGMISSLLGMRWDQVDTHEVQINDLQDQAQVLEGVVGYGQWYSKDNAEVAGWVRAERLRTQSGPSVGCSNDDNGIITLNSRGLWQVKVRARTGPGNGGNGLGVKIVCKMPDGSIVAEALWQANLGTYNAGLASYPHTVNVWCDVVAPVAGCTIETWVYARGIRTFYGGPLNNAVSVKKESNELGPGARLSQPFLLSSSEWVTLTPMQATGGGAVVDDSAVVGVDVTSARIDAVVVGSAPFDARLVANGTVVATSSGQSAHTLLSQGAVTPGDKFQIQVRGTADIYSSGNATWLTIMNRDQNSGSTE